MLYIGWMSTPADNKTSKLGLPPGSLVHIGQRKTEKASISVIDYTESNLIEKTCESVDDSFEFSKPGSNSWINVTGLHDLETISALGKHFDISNLILEDVLNTGHRPKAEELGGQLFLTLKMCGLTKNKRKIVFEQVSLILGEEWIMSFQEREGDVFGALRDRLRQGKANLRQKNVDYLFYRIIDIIVDHYLIVNEHLAEKIEQFESRAMVTTDEAFLTEIQRFRRTFLQFKRAVVPLKEAVVQLIKEPSPLVSEDSMTFLRDVRDHLVQLNDSIESHRDSLSGVVDLYMSLASHRANKVMKTLTVVATIFIPLTFITGLYGMNFDHMPSEIHWEHGYALIWGIMLLSVAALLIYFWRKKWF